MKFQEEMHFLAHKTRTTLFCNALKMALNEQSASHVVSCNSHEHQELVQSREAAIHNGGKERLDRNRKYNKEFHSTNLHPEKMYKA